MSDVDKLLSELLDSDDDSEVRASVDYHSPGRDRQRTFVTVAL